jgi:hypothetical protein
MAGKPEENSFTSVIESARTAAEQGIADIQTQADALFNEAASQVVRGGAVIADSVRQGVSVTEHYAAEGKASSSRRVGVSW